MIKKEVEKRIIVIFILTTILIYAAFALAGLINSAGSLLALSVALTVVLGILFGVFHKTFWAPALYVAALSTAIGLAIRAFFAWTGFVPSMFFAAVLAAMLVYKTLQAMLGAKIKGRLFAAVCLFLELAACVAVGITAKSNPGLKWQIFFALALCFFYSCTQLALRKAKGGNLWRAAAISYLMGFVFIFLLVILIAISIASEDGAPLEFLFEGVAEGVAEGVSAPASSKRKSKRL